MIFEFFVVISEFYMASQRSRRYLKTFLEPVAPSSLNMSPYHATATTFMPNIMSFMSSWQPRDFVDRPIFSIPRSPHLQSFEFGGPIQSCSQRLGIQTFSEHTFDLLKHRRVSGPANRQTYPKARFQGSTVSECFLGSHHISRKCLCSIYIYIYICVFFWKPTYFQKMTTAVCSIYIYIYIDIDIFQRNSLRLPKQKKMRDASKSIFAAVSRRDLCSGT